MPKMKEESEQPKIQPKPDTTKKQLPARQEPKKDNPMRTKVVIDQDDMILLNQLLRDLGYQDDETKKKAHAEREIEEKSEDNLLID